MARRVLLVTLDAYGHMHGNADKQYIRCVAKAPFLQTIYKKHPSFLLSQNCEGNMCMTPEKGAMMIATTKICETDNEAYQRCVSPDKMGLFPYGTTNTRVHAICTVSRKYMHDFVFAVEHMPLLGSAKLFVHVFHDLKGLDLLEALSALDNVVIGLKNTRYGVIASCNDLKDIDFEITSESSSLDCDETTRALQCLQSGSNCRIMNVEEKLRFENNRAKDSDIRGRCSNIPGLKNNLSDSCHILGKDCDIFRSEGCSSQDTAHSHTNPEKEDGDSTGVPDYKSDEPSLRATKGLDCSSNNLVEVNTDEKLTAKQSKSSESNHRSDKLTGAETPFTNHKQVSTSIESSDDNGLNIESMRSPRLQEQSYERPWMNEHTNRAMNILLGSELLTERYRRYVSSRHRKNQPDEQMPPILSTNEALIRPLDLVVFMDEDCRRYYEIAKRLKYTNHVVSMFKQRGRMQKIVDCAVNHEDIEPTILSILWKAGKTVCLVGPRISGRKTFKYLAGRNFERYEGRTRIFYWEDVQEDIHAGRDPMRDPIVKINLRKVSRRDNMESIKEMARRNKTHRQNDKMEKIGQNNPPKTQVRREDASKSAQTDADRDVGDSQKKREITKHPGVPMNTYQSTNGIDSNARNQDVIRADLNAFGNAQGIKAYTETYERPRIPMNINQSIVPLDRKLKAREVTKTSGTLVDDRPKDQFGHPGNFSMEHSVYTDKATGQYSISVFPNQRGTKDVETGIESSYSGCHPQTGNDNAIHKTAQSPKNGPECVQTTRESGNFDEEPICKNECTSRRSSCKVSYISSSETVQLPLQEYSTSLITTKSDMPGKSSKKFEGCQRGELSGKDFKQHRSVKKYDPNRFVLVDLTENPHFERCFGPQMPDRVEVDNYASNNAQRLDYTHLKTGSLNNIEVNDGDRAISRQNKFYNYSDARMQDNHFRRTQSCNELIYTDHITSTLANVESMEDGDHIELDTLKLNYDDEHKDATYIFPNFNLIFDQARVKEQQHEIDAPSCQESEISSQYNIFKVPVEEHDSLSEPFDFSATEEPESTGMSDRLNPFIPQKQYVKCTHIIANPGGPITTYPFCVSPLKQWSCTWRDLADFLYKLFRGPEDFFYFCFDTFVSSLGKADFDKVLSDFENTDTILRVIYDTCHAHGIVMCLTSTSAGIESYKDSLEDTDKIVELSNTDIPFIICQGDNPLGSFESSKNHTMRDIAPTLLGLLGVKTDVFNGNDLMMNYPNESHAFDQVSSDPDVF